MSDDPINGAGTKSIVLFAALMTSSVAMAKTEEAAKDMNYNILKTEKNSMPFAAQMSKQAPTARGMQLASSCTATATYNDGKYDADCTWDQ